MKLSTKGHYGVQAMFDLAQHYGQGPIPLKTVAERQGLSEHYLEQLIASLRKAGLVKSVRGAQGGYSLSKPPGEITVGDIVRVLEGPIAPLDCVNQDDPEHCQKSEHCVTKNVWAKVRDSISEVLDSVTLEDMCRDAEKINNYMYYI